MIFDLFSKNKETNPVPDILKLIPTESKLVDLEFLDDLRSVCYWHCGYSQVFSNKYLMLLLLRMSEEGLIVIEPVKTTLGLLYLTARK